MTGEDIDQLNQLCPVCGKWLIDECKCGLIGVRLVEGPGVLVPRAWVRILHPEPVLRGWCNRQHKRVPLFNYGIVARTSLQFLTPE